MYRGNRDTILKKIFYQFAKLMSVSTQFLIGIFFQKVEQAMSSKCIKPFIL